MYKFIFFATLVCLGSVSGARFDLPTLKAPKQIVYLRTNEAIATIPDHQPSYKYEFLDQHLWNPKGQNVRVFGLKTSGNAVLNLHDSRGALSDLSFALNTGEGAECSVRYMREKKPVELSFPCTLDLDGERMLWFALETKEDRAAIYPPGKHEPCAEISDLDLERYSVDFNAYDKYSVSSQHEALWDFQGHLLDRNDLKDQGLLRLRLWKGLKSVALSYKSMKHHAWRCDYARSELDKRHKRVSDKSKFDAFHYSYCTQNFMQPYLDSIVRHEALLLVNGVTLQRPETYDAAKFFEQYSG